MTHQATPAKLRSGEWGARVSETDVKVGDIVTITTRAGKTWDAQVADIVWSNDEVTLVATEKVGTTYSDRVARAAYAGADFSRKSGDEMVTERQRGYLESLMDQDQAGALSVMGGSPDWSTMTKRDASRYISAIKAQ